MDHAPVISGVILAAGSSSRLGRPKQLLDLFGEPLLRVTVRNVLASNLNEVILVLGHESDVIALAVGELGQQVVVNADYRNGQSTSLLLGLSSINAKSDAVIFFLGDQPQVDSSIINPLIAAFIKTNAPIVMPTYGGVPANPVLFSAALFDELSLVSGDLGARPVVKRHAADVLQVPVSLPTPPRDVDTDEDYQELLDLLRPAHPAS